MTGESLTVTPEKCDSSCTYWVRCRKPHSCPVLQKTIAAKKKADKNFPTAAEIERAVDQEMRDNGEL